MMCLLKDESWGGEDVVGVPGNEGWKDMRW